MFVLGQHVTLKTGGPVMTVLGVGRHRSEAQIVIEVVHCVWTDEAETTHHEYYHPELLQLVKLPDVPPGDP